MEQNEAIKNILQQVAGREITLLKYTSAMTPTAHGDIQARTQGGGFAMGARAPPLLHNLEKKFRSWMSKQGEKVPPKYVGKKECARSAQIRQN